MLFHLSISSIYSSPKNVGLDSWSWVRSCAGKFTSAALAKVESNEAQRFTLLGVGNKFLIFLFSGQIPGSSYVHRPRTYDPCQLRDPNLRNQVGAWFSLLPRISQPPTRQDTRNASEPPTTPNPIGFMESCRRTSYISEQTIELDGAFPLATRRSFSLPLRSDIPIANVKDMASSYEPGCGIGCRIYPSSVDCALHSLALRESKGW